MTSVPRAADASTAGADGATARVEGSAGPGSAGAATPGGKPGAASSTRKPDAACRCHADPPQLHGPYHQWTRKKNGKTATGPLSSSLIAVSLSPLVGRGSGPRSCLAGYCPLEWAAAIALNGP